MVSYSVSIGGVKYPILCLPRRRPGLRFERYLDLRPSLITAVIPFQSGVSFGNYVPMQVFRDGHLYLQGSFYRPDDYWDSSGAYTVVLGACNKSRLWRRFEKSIGGTVTSKVKYRGATEVSMFTDIIDASAGLTEGRVDATSVTLSHNFSGESCAEAIEIIAGLTDRECYVSNDYKVDFVSSIGKDSGLDLVAGVNLLEARRTRGDGFKVRNDVEIWYASGKKKLKAADTDGQAQFGRRDLTWDLGSVTDTAAVTTYRDTALRVYKRPLVHSAVVFVDETVGFTYDVGDWVKVSVPDIGFAGRLRIYGITKEYSEKGDITALALAENVRFADTRRYRANDLSDIVASVRGQIHALWTE